MVEGKEGYDSGLPKKQGISYESPTTDIYCHLIGKLACIIPYEDEEW